jgi:hypothetical protein
MERYWYLLFKEKAWRLSPVDRYAESKRSLFMWQDDVSGEWEIDKFLV